MSLSKPYQALLNKARVVGGTPTVYISNSELAFLLCLVCYDLGIAHPSELSCKICLANTTWLYDITPQDCQCPTISEDKSGDLKIASILHELIQINQDIFTYFWAIVSLHAQRKKFHAIVTTQSLPELETIIPRGLLELGILPTKTLASWLLWRKFIYDIDNRSAQTTGYLFEPILAMSIGGVAYGAKNSPIKRNGQGSGRQVDCIINKHAYEFKMRVTIAASGQGRFGEELSFAQDCYLSGYLPQLLVLDPTPSIKLDELSKAYRQFGGEAYIGDEAWGHLEEHAGKIMSQFLEKYIKTPITTIENNHAQLADLSLQFDPVTNGIIITIDDYQFRLR